MTHEETHGDIVVAERPAPGTPRLFSVMWTWLMAPIVSAISAGTSFSSILVWKVSKR